ncbi:MAG: RHS repeat protein [Ignavibacteriales bacterium]|nr:RHS repeat protein [Ignavibacteriales bacterium]
MRETIYLLTFFFCYALFGQITPTSSADKFNKRGIFNNENLKERGNEIISDYDGNLMLQYSTLLNAPNEMASDLTILYNANVEHKYFHHTLATETDFLEAYNYNKGEWIFGFMGFALQVLNFEQNFYIDLPNIPGDIIEGQENVSLIPGYHYSNSLNTFGYGNQDYDEIQILRSDGSKLLLQNTEPNLRTGIYVELGENSQGYAIVDSEKEYKSELLRRVTYFPGDGNIYYFQEEYSYYPIACDFNLPPGSGILNYDRRPKTIYLLAIKSQTGNVVRFEYDNLLENENGRNLFLTNISCNNLYSINLIYGENGAIEINNFSNNENLHIYTNNALNTATHPENNPIADRSLMIKTITDDLARTDTISYICTDKKFYHLLDASMTCIVKPKVFLPSNIKYYTGKETTLDYVSLSDTIHVTNYSSYSNEATDSKFRDYIHNNMIAKRILKNRYEGSEKFDEMQETYIYSFNKPTGFNWGSHRANDIKTTIKKENKLLNEQIPEEFSESITPFSTEITKNYSQYPIKSYNGDLSNDGSATIKLMSETKTTGTEIVKVKYLYDLGDSTGGTFNGKFDIISKIEENTKNGKTITKISNYQNIYETFNIFNKNIDVLKKSIEQDPMTITTEVTYKNFLPIDNEGQFSIDSNFYKIGLIQEQKVYSDTLIKSHIINEFYPKVKSYFPSLPQSSYLSYSPNNLSFLSNVIRQVYLPSYDDSLYWNRYNNAYLYSGFIKKSTNFPGTPKETFLEYKYYPHNMKVKSINSDNKILTEFEYNDFLPGPVALDGKIVTYQGHENKVTAYYYAHTSSQPSRTKITSLIDNKVLFDTYTYCNEKGEPTIEKDPNGFFSWYKYDKIGRITNAIFPGRFIDGSTIQLENPININPGNLTCYIDTTKIEITRIKNNTTTNNSWFRTSMPGEVLLWSIYNQPIQLPLENGDSTLLGDYIENIQFTTYFNNRKIWSDGNSDTLIIQVKGTYCDSINNTFKIRNDFGNSIEVQLPSGAFLEPYTLKIDVTSLILDSLHAVSYLQFYIQQSHIPGNRKFGFNIISTPYLKRNNSEIIENVRESSVTINYDDNNNIINYSKFFQLTSGSDGEIKMTNKYDAFGRLRKVEKYNGSTFDNKSKVEYNYLGLQKRVLDPMERYAQTEYDYFGKPKIVITGKTIPTAKTIDYGIQNATTEYTLTTDEENKTVKTFYDKVGNVVKEERIIDVNNPNIKATNYFNYDNLYRLTSVISPKGLTTTYLYDDYSNIIQKTTPDEGITKYKYDKYGNLRFSFNPASKLVFTKYDLLNRPIIIGTLTSAYNIDNLNPDSDYGSSQGGITAFENYYDNQGNFLIVNKYDTLVTNGVFAGLTLPQDVTLENLKGRIALTAFRDVQSNGWSYKYYSYDHLGRISKFGIKYTDKPWVNFENYYDHLGNMTAQKFTGWGEYYVWYSYDNQGRLYQVRSNTTNNYGSAKLEATYNYNLADQIDSSTLGSITMNYGYDVNRGWLNDMYYTKSLTQFWEVLQYYNNGNIKYQKLLNKQLNSTPLEYLYSYDGMNRLTAVNCTTATNYSETYTYDMDGNFNTFTKGNEGQRGNLIYHYLPNTNRLSYIDGSALIDFWYDGKGNLTQKLDEGNNTVLMINNYDHRNLPLEMDMDGLIFKYFYDDQGNRIIKEQTNGTNKVKEFYLRDAAGREIAVYDLTSNKLKFVNLYGNGLIGRVEIFK